MAVGGEGESERAVGELVSERVREWDESRTHSGNRERVRRARGVGLGWGGGKESMPYHREYS